MKNNLINSDQHLPTIKILSTGFRSTTFTVDWELYTYENDICCNSLYKWKPFDHNCIRYVCDYYPDKVDWEQPIWMKEVFSMIGKADETEEKVLSN